MRSKKFSSLLLIALAVTASAWTLSPAHRDLGDASQTAASSQVIAFAALPRQGRAVYRKIHAGSDFPYEKDGDIFGNYEKRLPMQPRGWYREYTVPTPGVRGRGARRIVCGGEKITRPEACYYTADHYESFRRIIPADD